MRIQKDSIYLGDFEDNKKHGDGEIRWLNGDWFKGSWQKGQVVGQGQIGFKSHERVSMVRKISTQENELKSQVKKKVKQDKNTA